MFKKFLRAYVAYRTSYVLNQLTDAQLRDIGLERSQIAERAREVGETL